MKLRVWWIPQVPMKSFHVPVSSFREARLVLDTLAMYDLFQYKNKVKPDYANAGGLQIFDEEEKDWVDWCDEETGDGFDEYCANKGTGWNIANKIRKINDSLN
jgi:hypothetical protein